MTTYEIPVDKFTGVQYMFVYNSATGSAAVTPLIDANGRPLLTAEAQSAQWFGQMPGQLPNTNPQ